MHPRGPAAHADGLGSDLVGDVAGNPDRSHGRAQLGVIHFRMQLVTAEYCLSKEVAERLASFALTAAAIY